VTEPLALTRTLGLRRIAQDLADRLTRGEHLVLWGPIGSGKTTLLDALRRRIADRACAIAPVTQSLDDITRALERAFPGVTTQGIPRRVARARLWRAADRAPAVLLLDHVSKVNTAMKWFLRRLRGGIAGVLLVFDIDSPRERARLRAQHLGCLSVRIPALPSRVQRGLLVAHWPKDEHPHPGPAVVRLLIRAARGRPGWIVVCAEQASKPRYWGADGLKARVLALDAELRVRALKQQLSDSEACRESNLDRSTCMLILVIFIAGCLVGAEARAA
jgi:energy-coupling factor transporter ATP-binding protein EcfA2